MSELREWLESASLDSQLVTIKGKQFKVVECNMAERSRVLASHAKNGEVPNDVAEALLLSLSVVDPATDQRVVEPEDYKVWTKLGLGFSPLLRACLDVNGLRFDEVEDEVKNSEATTG